MFWQYTLLTPVLVVVALWSIFKFYRGRRKRSLLSKIPGPKAFPFVGNFFELLVPNEELGRVHSEFRRRYGERYQIQYGSCYYVALYSPDDIEKVLSSSVHTDKGDTYDFITPWLGDGLLTSSGSKWHRRRKMLTPAFHFRILEDFLRVFNEQSSTFVETLGRNFHRDNEHNNGRDICPFITRCTLDMIGETALGVKLNCQRDWDSPYLQSISQLCELMAFRIHRPWLWPDLVWYCTHYGTRWNLALKTLHDVTDKVIASRKDILELKELDNNNADLGLEGVYWNGKPKLTFLDLLLEAQKESQNGLTDGDIQEEVDTFMFEGHDTTSAALSWAIFLLGCNPHCQSKLHSELDQIFGDDRTRPINPKDLTEMKYLEMCIKEALRLYPSVPFFSRLLKSDLSLNKDTTIPAGVNVFFLPSLIHREERIFPKPELFDPERFLPQNRARRHPFAYIPFSAGPRNCIGQKFAMMEEKVLLANLFRNFRVVAVDSPENVVVMMEVVTRSRDGLRVKLISRK